MLILKNPLKLQSVSALGINSDCLGEKICGNYQTFGAAITGEELLHMTVQEPDIYVGIKNDGPFLVDNQIQVDNQVRLELVNRLVNRLMLYSSPQFTYQDEVFVATVLQKLGIADVNEFMQQIKLHMEENVLAVSLMNRYFDAGREFSYTVNRLVENAVSDRQELELMKSEYQSERYLHNDIFRRLMTAECCNTVYCYQNPMQVRERAAGSFQLIEWIRQADRIQLSQYRENIYWQTNPAVFSSYSGYEMNPLTVNELTRRKVIERMSAAVLENFVSVAGYALQYEYGSTNIWKNYDRIFYGSAENVLKRFHYYQEHGAVGDAQLKAYTARMNVLVQDELHLTQLLEFVDRSDNSSEEDVYEDLRQDIVFTMLENQNLQKQLVIELQAARQAQMWTQPHTYYMEERNQYIDECSRFETAYRHLRQNKNEHYSFSDTQRYSLGENTDDFEDDGTLGFLAAIGVENALQKHTDSIKKDIDKRLQKTAEKDEDTDYQPVWAQAPESGQAVYELIHRYAESAADADVPLMENIELLEQINQHNLYMKQLLDSKENTKDTPRRVVVDRAQARETALRALDHPEQVLQEIYGNAADERKIPLALLNQIPNEIERILSVTDENTKTYYRHLMGYDSDSAPRTEPENGERNEYKTVVPEQAGQETDAQTLFLETIRSVLNTADTDTQDFGQQRMQYQTADTVHPQEYTQAGESVLTEKEQIWRGEMQKKIYALLRRIDRREHLYRTNTLIQAQEPEEQVQSVQIQKQTADIQHRRGILRLKEIDTLEHQDILYRQMASVSQNIERNVQMVHKTREQTNQEIVDEVLATIENSSVLRQNIEQKDEETLLAAHQIEQIRNELIVQSREQITHMVEHSMKTHVHALSDMVYLELERRLKNEQRRRGY